MFEEVVVGGGHSSAKSAARMNDTVVTAAESESNMETDSADSESSDFRTGS